MICWFALMMASLIHAYNLVLVDPPLSAFDRHSVGKKSPILGGKRQDKPDLYRIASLAQICKFQIVLLIGKIS